MFDEQGGLGLAKEVVVLTDSDPDRAITELTAQGVRAIGRPLAINDVLLGQVPPPLSGATVLAFITENRTEAQIEELSSLLDQHPVIVVCDSRLPSLTRQAIAIGASEILPFRFSPEDLRQAVKNCRLKKPSRDPASRHGLTHKTVGFLTSGGGVGASALLSQLGFILAQDNPDCNIALVDMDIQFGSLAENCDVESPGSIVDILDAGDRLDGEFLRASMARAMKNLWVLGAPPRIVPLDRVGSSRMNQAMMLANREFHITLVDLPAVWTEWVYRALTSMTDIFIVLEPGVSHIRNARRQIEMIQQQGLGSRRVHVILNRIQSGLFAPFKPDAIEEALGQKVDVTVPSDFEVMSAALNRGVPIWKVKTRTKLEKQIRKIADMVKCDRSEGQQTR